MADGPTGRPAAVAGYPVRKERLRTGNQAVDLLVVDQLEKYVDRDSLLGDPGAVEPPYWAHLWPAARVLAARLAERESWAGQRVVELGCGLGLPAVIAAMKAGVVTAVDTAPEALAMTRANAELNGCTVNVVRGDLRHPPFAGSFDLCLAADVTYDPILQRALAAFLAVHLATNGLAWCVESVRTVDSGFRRACEGHGLAVVESEVTEIDEGRPVPVRVAEVRR